MPQLMDVIEFLDNSGSVMVKRVPESGPTEIKWGSQLTVRDTQEAIFFRDGQVVDTFKAGRYMLETKNIPEIGKWVTSFAYGPNSPFRAEVYFVNKKIFPNLKWGTQEPILFSDTVFKLIRLRAFGSYSIQITDSRVFMNQMVGTSGMFQDKDIADYLKNILLSKLTSVIGATAKSVIDLPASFSQIADAVKEALQADFANLGLSLHDFNVSSISVPENVQQMIDQRSGLSALGDMDEFMKYKAAMALETAAGNPSSAAGQMITQGLGLGMGFMMPQMVQQVMGQMAQPAQAAPVQSPVEKLKELKGLFDMGILTQSEFDEKKSKLLALL
ncbi:SPFH domain-containing protein [Mucilaginibacter sp. HMF5004]|uniref:SPFH domain-containing protein n=1 Tax=Mucilaginibacter rivuli TaxID=2857527 RepID=UPI001C5F5247|nr:SPFH domain-containing protein [Mucilaginibacter rivuli]MBW4890751.1 SPFH domain-containing protein [Mucilaginibacter rivuli]